MKINENYLKKIIKEEIRSVLFGPPMKQDVIQVFAKAIKLQHPQYLRINLEKMGIIPEEAIYLLKPDEVDPQFLQNACHMHNEMIKLPEIGGRGKSISIEAFSVFPKSDTESFMKSPALPRERGQIDYRRGEKNYIQEKKK